MDENPTQIKSATTIVKIEYFGLPPRWIFCRVETAGGIVGWGEGALEGHTQATEGAYRDLQRFVGWDADEISNIWQHAYHGSAFRGGPVLMAALSGLDIALWDIKGKRLGVPVWQLLGGKLRNQIKVYGLIQSVDGSTQSLFTSALHSSFQGFTAVRITIGDLKGSSQLKKLIDGVVAKLRDLRTLSIDVIVDFGGLNKITAKQLAEHLESYSPMFIQEPLFLSSPGEMRDLSKTVVTPIAVGEHFQSRNDFRPFFENRSIGIAQPDIAHCGGISELTRIATLAETFDVNLAPRCTLGPIALAATLQVDATVPNFSIQEVAWQVYNHTPITLQSGKEVLPSLQTYVLNPEIFTYTAGCITIPTGSGIGVEINEPLVREVSARYGRAA